MPGLIFNKYEKIRRLAQGGMGEVFLARQRGLMGFDRLVILKALREDLADEKDFVDQFLDEARVAATLNHPNIVALYEVDMWEGTYFMAMEYINGEDLSRLWYAAAKAGVGLPFQVSVKVIHDAAVGLDYAHHAMDVQGNLLHIVHRDVSPQNIMVRDDGVTKVVDFGIAKAANRITKTQAGTVKGKLQYMSPEQVRGDHLDGRSDQFSLGTVLWEMCTGKRLFKADSELETLNKILQHPIPRPSSIVDAFPDELERAIMRMLERDRDRRYPRLKDAAKDLKAYLDHAATAGGDQGVAEFVQEILGDELRARTADLTPEAEESEPSGAATVDNVPRPAGAVSVFSARGEQYPLPNRAAVQQAILDGRLRAEDQITEDGGKNWKRVGDIPDLQKFFSVAVAIDTMERSAKQAAPAPAPAPAPAQAPAPSDRGFRVNTEASRDLYPADEATEVAPDDDSANPTRSGEAKAHDPFLDQTEPSAALPAPQPTPELQIGPPTEPVPAPRPVAPEASQPYVAGAAPPEGAGPVLGDIGAVPETGQWSLGSVPQGADVAENYSFPPSLSQEIAAETSSRGPVRRRDSGARRLAVFMLLGASLAVAVGFVVVFTKPELVRPWVQRLQGVEPTAPPRPVDEARVIAALRSLDEPRLEKLAKEIAREGPEGEAAAAMLWTEVARSRAERARLAGLDAAEVQAARGRAYKLAKRAQGRAGPLGRLAMGAYHAEQLGLVEMKADLEAAEKGLTRPGWRAEAVRVRALAELTQGLVGETVDDGLRARAVSTAKTAEKDRRLTYLALLARNNAADDAWRADVERFFGDAHPAWRDAVLKSGGAEGAPKDPPRVDDKNGNGKDKPGGAAREDDDEEPESGGSPSGASYERLIARANAAQKRGRSRSAITLYKRALKAKPGDAAAYVGLGWAYVDAGNNRRARSAFQKALSADPNRADAALGIAEAMRFSGDEKSALPYYRKYLALSPGGPEAQVARNAISAIEARLKAEPEGGEGPGDEGGASDG